MTNGDWHVRSSNLSAPPFAGPNEPAIELGTDPIPPELIAFYNLFGSTVVSFQQWRLTSTDYQYMVLLNDVSGTITAWGKVTAGVVSQLYMIFRDSVSGKLTINFSGLGFGDPVFSLDAATEFLINERSQGRGLSVPAINIPASAAITAETVIATFDVSYRIGRAYEFRWDGLVRGAAGAGLVRFDVRRLNIAGSFYISNRVTATGNNDVSVEHVGRVANRSGTDFVQTHVLTMTSVTGGATTVQFLSPSNAIRGTMTVTDCGSEADWPNAIAVVP